MLTPSPRAENKPDQSGTAAGHTSSSQRPEILRMTFSHAGTRKWRRFTAAILITLFSLLSASAHASNSPTTAPDQDAALTDIQRATFDFFWKNANPISGLSREYSTRRPDYCATGASGMGFFNLVVGADRGFITRPQAAQRLDTALHFLAEKVDRFHGVFPHWFNGNTGKTIPFSQMDDGADLVETAYLAEGLLEVREYFTSTDPVETDVRTLADKLWRDIDWTAHIKQDGDNTFLMWHWSPNFGFGKNHPVVGFNECHITYILALASPTHPIPAKCYWTGWIGPKYITPRDDCGIHVTLGRGLQMPMFFTHYSYLGFDPHALSIKGKTYFEHFQDLCKVQVAYAMTKPDLYHGLWGLTACAGPNGYKAFAPGRDDGTLAPTAALSSIPYDPEDSLAFLKEINQHYRATLWGPFGFADSFNLSRNWISTDYLGIDEGPIAPMIENYRTGLCWKTFMKAPEIATAIRQIMDSEPKEYQ